MKRLRRALGPLAAAWLLCHVATVTLASSAFWTHAEHAGVECTCAHGPDSTCPMHHKAASGKKTCAMRSADDAATVGVGSVFGPIGLLPTPRLETAVITEQSVMSDEHSFAAQRPVPPDPPPPRA